MIDKLKNIEFEKLFSKLIPIVFLCFVVFLAIYTFSIGLQGDDFYYLTHPLTKEPINSLKVMIDSTNYYYISWNGRYIINFLNHLFVNLGMIVQTGVVVTSLCTAMYSLYKLFKIDVKFSSYFLLVIGFFTIASSEFLFNISCLNISLNYFLIIPFYAILIHYLVINKEKYTLVEMIGLCLLAFLCGCFTETYSFSLALLILIQIIRKQFDLKPQIFIIGVFYVIGVLVLLLCPGSGDRTSLITSNPLFIIYWLNGVVNAFCKWALLPMVMLILSYKFNKVSIKKIDKIDQLSLIYALIQMVMMIFSPYLPERTLILVNIIFISLSIKWSLNNIHMNLIPLMLGVALCGQLIVQVGIVVIGG